MMHRLREAMNSPGGLLGSRNKTVEADETFIGRKPGTTVRRGHGHKNAVFSLVERAGTSARTIASVTSTPVSLSTDDSHHEQAQAETTNTE